MQDIRTTSRLDAPRPLTLPGFHVMPGSHAPHATLPRHEHELPSICCVRSGGFTEYYDGRSVACGAGMTKVTPAGEAHWNRFGHRRTVGLRIDVEPGRFDGLPAVRGALDEKVFARDVALDRVAARIMAQLRMPDDAARIVVEGLLLELVGQLARQQDGGRAAHEPWLRRAHQVVHELFRTRLSLSAVAELVGVHPSTLARAYRSAFHCTVGEHIRMLRLEHAAAELTRSDRPLTAVAMDAGFYDQSHFAHAFRRRFGSTPGEYRRRHAPPATAASSRRTPRSSAGPPAMRAH